MRRTAIALALAAAVLAASLWLFRGEGKKGEQSARANATPSKLVPPLAYVGGSSRATDEAACTVDAAQVPPWRARLYALQADDGRMFGMPRDSDWPAELQRFVEGLSLADLSAALQMLHRAQEKMPTVIGRNLEMRVLQRWAENEPESAAAWALAAPDGIRQEAIGRAAGAWAERALSDAAGWVAQLPGGAERGSAAMSVAAEAAYKDPLLALELASLVPPGTEHDDLIARASAVWAAEAPESAVAWVKAIPEAGLREQALSSVAITLADANPTLAAELLSFLTSSKLRNEVTAAIVQRLALTDPGAVKDWVDQLSAGDLRDTAKNALQDVVERIDRS